MQIELRTSIAIGRRENGFDVGSTTPTQTAGQVWLAEKSMLFASAGELGTGHGHFCEKGGRIVYALSGNAAPPRDFPDELRVIGLAKVERRSARNINFERADRHRFAISGPENAHLGGVRASLRTFADAARKTIAFHTGRCAFNDTGGPTGKDQAT